MLIAYSRNLHLQCISNFLYHRVRHQCTLVVGVLGNDGVDGLDYLGYAIHDLYFEYSHLNQLTSYFFANQKKVSDSNHGVASHHDPVHHVVLAMNHTYRDRRDYYDYATGNCDVGVDLRSHYLTSASHDQNLFAYYQSSNYPNLDYHDGDEELDH